MNRLDGTGQELGDGEDSDFGAGGCGGGERNGVGDDQFLKG